ncbi:transcriptional regulator MarR family [Candidatus Termititenax aidoneus]|uniref:Transcriptional regulator MarR family n=1 Tax=Termititenax aidoneus TaxID=2218524 RepID=A0A388TBS4_TERA1|nr:transcriptional regulator MarR family [Candidatus Termititenax aidoneus]
MRCLQKETSCPAEITICLIGNKWKLLILRELSFGTKRFGELLRKVVGISQKVLTQSLRSMEEDGLISRKVYAEVPPKVEYTMTALAKDLSKLLDLMADWGLKYKALYTKKPKTASGKDEAAALGKG